MRDDLGVRVERVASKKIPHGAPAVEGNLVGFAAKADQLDRFVRPTDEEATTILEEETYVLFIGGLHESAVDADWMPEGAEEGDLLYIDPADNSVHRDASGTAAKNEVQEVSVKAKKGNFKLSFDGETTAAIKFDASAAEVKAALEALSNIDPGDVAVTGGPGDEGGTKPFVITFGGQYADTDVPELTADEDTLEEPGEVSVSTKTVGVAASALPLGVLEEIDTSRTPDVALINTNAWQAFQGQ